MKMKLDLCVHICHRSSCVAQLIDSLKCANSFFFVLSSYFCRYAGCLDCECNEFGVTDMQCSEQGICYCQGRVDGIKCDLCPEGMFGLPYKMCEREFFSCS